MLSWSLSAFSQLGLEDLYDILKLRQEVFVVEQNCVYQDLDGLDDSALHLVARDETGALMAYCRIFTDRPDTLSVIGRVIVAPTGRGSGLGYTLMERAIHCCLERKPDNEIYISAQAHLEDFYARLGFTKSTEPYDEDGIPHIGMHYRLS